MPSGYSAIDDAPGVDIDAASRRFGIDSARSVHDGDRPMTPADRALRILVETSGVRGQYGVNSKDVVFLEDIQKRNPAALTDRQENWLRDIEKRAFGEDDE